RGAARGRRGTPAASRRAHRVRGGRPGPERARLHRPRARGRGRPALRHEVAARGAAARRGDLRTWHRVSTDAAGPLPAEHLLPEMETPDRAIPFTLLRLAPVSVFVAWIAGACYAITYLASH